jgi:hypothetical protein
MVSLWRSFLSAEAEHCSEGQLNRLFRATDTLIRYEAYLRTILVRHASIVQGLKALDAGYTRILQQGGLQLTAEDSILSARRAEFTFGLAFEIETFYLFAKIYLDRIAQFLGRYFGSLRGASTKSHDQLTKNWRAFQEGHGLEVPEGFERQLIDLKDRIAEFRDDQSVNYAVEGVDLDMLGESGEELGMTPAHPANRWASTMQAESEGLNGLASALDEYCEAVQSIVFTTRARSRFLKVLQRQDWPRNLTD